MTQTINANTNISLDVAPAAGTGPTFDIDGAFILTIDLTVLVSSEDDEVVVSDDDGASLTNNGTIFAAPFFNVFGAVLFEGADSTVINNADGRIIARATGIDISGDGGTVINHGIVTSAARAGVAAGADNVALSNEGLISGQTGVLSFGLGNLVENAGTIGGDTGIIAQGSLLDIDNAAGGVIQGVNEAIFTNNFGRINLDNRGTVDGDILCNGDLKDVVTNRGDILGTVELGSGDDTFRGLGNSTSGKVFGEAGEDTLIGGNRNDTLNGGGGSDVLRGGSGKDVLVGGSESDIFDFNFAKDSKAGGQRDVINDLVRGVDDIDLRGIDAKWGVNGNQKFKFIGKQDFHDMKGELRIEDKGNKVIVQGDLNGDSKADFEVLVKVGFLTAADFLL